MNRSTLECIGLVFITSGLYCWNATLCAFNQELLNYSPSKQSAVHISMNCYRFPSLTLRVTLPLITPLRVVLPCYLFCWNISPSFYYLSFIGPLPSRAFSFTNLLAHPPYPTTLISNTSVVTSGVTIWHLMFFPWLHLAVPVWEKLYYLTWTTPNCYLIPSTKQNSNYIKNDMS